MNKNKYFKVKQITTANGDIVFKVLGYNTRIDMFFGISYDYSLENKTLEEAIDQIETIVEFKITDEKVVYKRTVS